MTAKLSDPALRGLVKRVRVQTEAYKRVMARFKQWILGAKLGIQICALILGDSGVGKTVIAKAICETYGSYRDAKGQTSPVVFVQTPESPSSIALIEAILESLGDPRPGSGTKRTKLRRLLKMFRDQSVLIVVLDDVQQLVDSDREWLIYETSECLKTIIKMSSVSFVGFGLQDAVLLPNSNEQWERLNQGTIRIERFDWQDTDSKQEFKRVLSSFQNKLNMFELPDISSNTMALRFYLASGGLIDYISKILLQATWDAIDESRKTISLTHLHEAWQSAICLTTDLGYQPFQMKIDAKGDYRGQIAKAKQIVMHKAKKTPSRRPGKRSHLAEIGLK